MDQVNAEIPLSYKAPVFQDPNEMAKNALSVRSLIQQQQMGKLQIEQEQMKNQQAQRAIAAQQALGQSLSQHTTLGPDGNLTVDHGAVIKSLADAGFGEDAMKYDTQRRADLKSAMDLEEAKTKVQGQKAGRMGALAGSVPQVNFDEPDEGKKNAQILQSKTALKNVVDQAVQEGLLDPQHAQAMEGAEYTPEMQQQIQQIAQQSMTVEQQNAQHLANVKELREKALNDSTIAKNQAEIPGLQAKAVQEQLSAFGQAASSVQDQAGWDQLRASFPDVAKKLPQNFTPAGAQLAQKLALTVEQQSNLADKAATRGETARHNAVDESTARGRLGVEQQNSALKRLEIDPFGMLGGAGGKGGAASKLAPDAHGDAVLQALPQPVGDQVKALAEGRMAFPAGFALKSPYWQHMISLVSQYDPSFDAVNYTARQKTRSDFTSGKSAGQVNALNTVIGHLDSLSQSADKLKNSSIPLINGVANWAASNTGDPRVKEFEANKKAVVDELTKAWRGSGGSEGDIKSWSDTLNASQSPAQMHGVIAKMGELLGSKIDALGEQYKNGMGTTSQGLELLTPQASKTLAKIQGKAPAATASKAAASKTVPSDLVHQYAVEHKIDDATAKQVFTQKGYTVQ